MTSWTCCAVSPSAVRKPHSRGDRFSSTETSRGWPQHQVVFVFSKCRGIGKRLFDILRFQVGVLSEDLLDRLAGRDHLTTMPTEMRSSLTHGLPPRRSGSTVIRS